MNQFYRSLKNVVIYLIAIVLMLTSYSTNIIATESNHNMSSVNLNEVVIEENEYNEYLNLKRNVTSYFKLDKSTDLNEKIMQYEKEYDRFIYELMERYNSQELKRFNYSEDQIKAIKSFDGSEELRIAASAVITSSLSLSSYSYNSLNDRTTLRMGYTINISGIEFMPGQRNAGVTIGGSQAAYFFSTSNLSLTYTSASNNKIYENYVSGSRTIHSGAGVSYSFKPVLSVNAPMNPIPYYLTNLNLSYTANAGGRVTISGLTGKYITHKLSLGVGFSISGSGIGISLEPKWTWSVLDSKTRTVYLQ